MNKRQLKIFIVVHCFLPESVGGTEFYTYHLARELIKKGHRVTILAAVQDMTVKRYKTVASDFEGIRVMKIANSPVYSTSFIDYFIDPNVDRIFKEIIEQEKPDLIHFQHTANLSSRLPEIAAQLCIPTIFTIHDYWYVCLNSHFLSPSGGICLGPSEGLVCASCNDSSSSSPAAVPRFPIVNRTIQLPFFRRLNLKEKLPPGIKQKLRGFLYKVPDSRNDSNAAQNNPYVLTILENQFRFNFFKRQFLFPKFVLSPSRHLKERFEKEWHREIIHLPLGFYMTDKVTNLPFGNKLKIAYLGNIVPFKGAAVILRELLKMRKGEMVEAHFYGRPANEWYFKEVRKLSETFPEGRVMFHGGYRSDKELGEILSKVHLVVFPSLWEENYPLVVRETLLHGVPVIGSRLGGVPEAIEDGVNGFLFDPYKEGDLAAKLELIMEHPEILAKITEGARNTKIESMEDHIKKIMDLYDEAIGSGKRGKAHQTL